jgi:hypothetical protein
MPRPRFTPGKSASGTHWTRCWVGLRAGLDTEAGERILPVCQGSNLERQVAQFLARHYTD